MHKSQPKAQMLALSVFGVMYFGAIAFIVYEPPTANGRLVVLLLNVDAYLACIVAGYLAAAVGRRQGPTAGALAGVIAACLVAIYHFSFGPGDVVINDWRFWTASVLLGSFGGLLWTLKQRAASWSGTSR